MIMGQLTILPKHWWTGKDASGNQRDPMKTTLEPPLGSGPYRIKEVKPGRSIVYERVKDYWGKDLPVNARAVELRRDPLRILPRRDRRLRELQGRQSRLLAGDERQELGHGLRLRRRARRSTSSGRRWRSSATQPMQCFVLNLRRPQFAGPPRAAGVQSRLRLRVGEQEFVLRAICAGRQLLPGQRARRAADAAGRARARDPERGEGRRAAGGVHQGARESGQQDARRHAQQSAQSRAAAEGGRLGDQERRADQRARPASR